MAAPVVENYNDVLASLTQANQPLLSNLDQQAQDITASGLAGVQGIEGTKNQAFTGITNAANARGMTFSGFTPDAQATYTANTYLPALAKLQQSIQESRTALAGQKAGIVSNINKEGLDVVKSEKTALQNWQDQQDQMSFTAEQNRIKMANDAEQNKIKMANDADVLAKTQAFQAAQAQLDRDASAANQRSAQAAAAALAAAKEKASQPTQQQYISGLFSAVDADGNPLVNKEGYTEKVVIPSFAADYGLSKEEAAKAVYDFRRQYYESGNNPVPLANDPKFSGAQYPNTFIGPKK